MISLNTCKYLNEWLGNLFSNESVYKIGVGLKNDLEVLYKSYPHMSCFSQPMKSEIELLDCFHALYPTKRSGGLAGIAERLFGRTLCKVEQVSDWSRRPLRKAQLHYAALDAHIEIYIWQKFEESIIEQGRSVEEFLRNLKKKRGEKGMEPEVKCKRCNSRMHDTTDCDKGVKCKFCSVFGHRVKECSSVNT